MSENLSEVVFFTCLFLSVRVLDHLAYFGGIEVMLRAEEGQLRVEELRKRSNTSYI